jgi:protein-tyrosine-phosphatase
VAADVLFLCTGNICRSPVAEVVARDLCSDQGLTFASAGLDTVVGHPASSGSVACVAAWGLDLAAHHSQPVTRDILQNAEWVIGMTRSHAALFRSRYGSGFAGRIGYLGAPGVDLAGGGPSPDGDEVEDPYGGSQDQYDAACGKIRRLMGPWQLFFAAPGDDQKVDR